MILSRLCRRFRADRRGAVAILIAVLAVPLLLAGGLALDATRLWLVRIHLQHAVDAASLLGAAEIGSQNQVSDTQALFWVNYSESPASSGNGYLGSTSSGATVTQVDSTHVQVTATATVPLTLMALAPGATSKAASASAIAVKNAGYEITLALDITGSMLACADGSTNYSTCTTKEAALQNGAINLTEAVYGSGNDTVAGLSMAVVPFRGSVNIGSSHTSWLTGYNSSNWSLQAWRGCVMARTGNDDVSEVDPATKAFSTLYWPTTYHVKTIGSSYADGDNDYYSGNVTDNGNKPSSTNQWSSFGVGPNLGCNANAVLPLTQSKSTVEKAINGLTAASGGSTMLSQGMQWAWFTLSPLWQNDWNLPSGPGGTSRPLNYTVSNNTKVVVLMTDGDGEWDGNELSSKNYLCSNDQVYPECTQTDGYVTSYGRLSDNRLNITMPVSASNSQTDYGKASQQASDSAATAIDNKTSTVCTSMKNKGIVIYTIAFQAAQGSAAQTLLQGCATDSAHYFNTQTGDDINAAFQAIGKQLSAPRVTQ